MKRFAFMLFTLTLTHWNSALFAKVPTEGPLIRFNQSGTMKASEESHWPAEKLQTQFMTVKLLFPVSLLDGKFRLIPYFRLSSTNHTWTSKHEFDAPKHAKHTILGSIITSELPNDRFKMFVGAFHHDNIGNFNRKASMAEYYLGADVSEALRALWPHSTYEIYGRITARQRQYPGRKTQLLIPELTLMNAEGYIFSIGIPSHVVFGRFLNEQTRYIAGEVEISSRQFVSSAFNTSGWLDGYTVAAFAHWREQVWTPLHISLKIGANFQVFRFYDLNGTEKGEFTGSPAPYGSVSLTTLF